MTLVKRTAYQEGDTDAKICFVAEAPGGTEVSLGRPLVGPSGRLFDECLHQAGLVRSESHILNLFDRRLTRDRVGKTITDEIGDIVWTDRGGFTQHAEPYFRRFHKRLAKSQANVVVPMGGLPFEALTGKQGILKWRGSILRGEYADNRKVIGTIHPAAVLRGNYTWRYLIINDLEKIKRHCDNSRIILPKRNIIIEPSYEDTLGFLSSLGSAKQVAFDIEITNEQVSCISFSRDPSEAISVPLMRSMVNSYWRPSQEAAIWSAIQKVLRNPAAKKVNQNILFDIHVLWYKNAIDCDISAGLGDPMVAHHIIYPDFNKGLDLICSVCTDEPYYKDEGKTWRYVKDWPQFWAYNAKDAAVALECWNALEPILDEEGYRTTYDIHMANIPWMLYFMDDGFQIDTERFDYVDRKVADDLERLEAEFLEKADYEFNYNSAAQAKKYFYEHKGIKPYVSTKTRKPTCDDKALARIARRYNLHEARLIQEMKKLRKFKGSYLKLQFDPDHKFRCSVNIRGTKNGRASMGKTVFGTGSNMQNLPERFQDFLGVDKDG